MKRAFLFLPLFLLSATSLYAQEKKVFENPTVDGGRLDFCLVWGDQCGKAAADAFCKMQGLAGANAWEPANDVGPTIVLTGRKPCNEQWCDGFASITCTGTTTNPEGCPMEAQPFQRTVYGWGQYQREVQQLPPDQQATLADIGNLIKNSFQDMCPPVRTVEVQGHADWDTPRNPEREQHMSEERAQAATDWLKDYVGASIAEQITWDTKGLGATKLKASPTSEANRRQNRRVEVLAYYSSASSPDSAPPESAPSESAPPESAPSESAPPESEPSTTEEEKPARKRVVAFGTWVINPIPAIVQATSAFHMRFQLQNMSSSRVKVSITTNLGDQKVAVMLPRDEANLRFMNRGQSNWVFTVLREAFDEKETEEGLTETEKGQTETEEGQTETEDGQTEAGQITWKLFEHEQ
jgi:OmpA family